MTDYLMVVFVTWMAFWVGVIGLLCSFRSAFREPDSETHFRECFAQSNTDYVLATGVRIAYAAPRRLFGQKLLSLRAIGVSCILTTVIFLIFLSIALVTTPISTESKSNDVLEFIHTMDMDNLTKRIGSAQLFADPSDNFAYTDFWWRLYTATAISTLSAFMFEFLCLTKSRFFLRKVRPTTANTSIILILIGDIISTIPIFVLYYSVVWACCQLSMELIYDDKLISPLMRQRMDNEISLALPVHTTPISLFEWINLVKYIIISDMSRIVSAIKFEVSTKFSAFVVLYDSYEMEVLSSKMFKTIASFPGGITEYIKDHHIDESEFVKLQYSSFVLPVSLTLASALFTSIWTAIVMILLLVSRTIWKLSLRWRALILLCCRKPHLVFNRAITPCLIICITGIFLMTLQYLYK